MVIDYLLTLNGLFQQIVTVGDPEFGIRQMAGDDFPLAILQQEDDSAVQPARVKNRTRCSFEKGFATCNLAMQNANRFKP